ncbi:MAG: hypothetical protein F6K50_03980 [Moorea sp. SIO3I7]|nr:hypothetical protein [Moorena sp. SIO3I7]
MASRRTRLLLAHIKGIGFLVLTAPMMITLGLPHSINSFFPEAHLMSNFFDPDRDILFWNAVNLFTREGLEALGAMSALKVTQWCLLTAPFGKIFSWLPWKNKKRLMLAGLLLCFYEFLLILSATFPTEFEVSISAMFSFLFYSLFTICIPWMIYGFICLYINLYKSFLDLEREERLLNIDLDPNDIN